LGGRKDSVSELLPLVSERSFDGKSVTINPFINHSFIHSTCNSHSREEFPSFMEEPIDDLSLKRRETLASTVDEVPFLSHEIKSHKNNTKEEETWRKGRRFGIGKLSRGIETQSRVFY